MNQTRFKRDVPLILCFLSMGLAVYTIFTMQEIKSIKPDPNLQVLPDSGYIDSSMFRPLVHSSPITLEDDVPGMLGTGTDGKSGGVKIDSQCIVTNLYDTISLPSLSGGIITKSPSGRQYYVGRNKIKPIVEVPPQNNEDQGTDHPDCSWRVCDYDDSLSKNFNFYIRYQMPWFPGGGEIISRVLRRIPEDSMKVWIGKKTWDSLCELDSPQH